jgi:hypothetical protein
MADDFVESTNANDGTSSLSTIPPLHATSNGTDEGDMGAVPGSWWEDLSQISSGSLCYVSVWSWGGIQKRA